MQDKILNAVVIFSGVIAALAFYMFWNTPNGQEKNLKTTPFSSIQKENTKQITPIKEVIDQKHYDESLLTPVQNNNPSEMREHTQEVYETIKPENYASIMERASNAFVALEEHVQKTDEELKEHFENFKPLNHVVIPVDSGDVNPNHEMELPIIEK